MSARPRGQRTDRDWLEDIDAHATIVAERALDGKQRFLEDLERQDSILRRLELIGEAVTGLTKDLRDRHPDVPWSDLVAFRAKVIHHYFMVDLERVWSVVVRDLPTLHAQVRDVLAHELTQEAGRRTE